MVVAADVVAPVGAIAALDYVAAGTVGLQLPIAPLRPRGGGVPDAEGGGSRQRLCRISALLLRPYFSLYCRPPCRTSGRTLPQ